MQKVICRDCSKENLPNARFCSNCGHQLPKISSTPIELSVPEEKPSANRTKLYGAIFGALMVGLTGWGVQHFLSMKPSPENELMQMANEMNKTCPVMVDAETQLDNGMAISKNTFQYNYTLVNMERAKIDTNEFKSYMLPNIIGPLRTNPQMKYFRDNKITMNYKYVDRKKEHVMIISISPDMYE
jgi:hypothetical protein